MPSGCPNLHDFPQVQQKGVRAIVLIWDGILIFGLEVCGLSHAALY